MGGRRGRGFQGVGSYQRDQNIYAAVNHSRFTKLIGSSDASMEEEKKTVGVFM